MNGSERNLLLFHKVDYKGIDGSSVLEVFKAYWFVKDVGYPFSGQLKNSPKMILVNCNFHYICSQGGFYNFRFR